MPISTGNIEVNVAEDLARIYAEAERAAMDKVARAVSKGLDDADHWTVRKAVQLRRLREQLETEIVAELDKNIPQKAHDLVAESYRRGRQAGLFDLRRAGVNAIMGFGVADPRKIEALASALSNNLLGSHLRIVRQCADVYQECVAPGSANVLAGVETRRQASQRILNQFADRGITGFVDRAGRHWTLASYTEMATRTTTAQAAITGHLDRLLENGRDLIMVSNQSVTCPLCSPYDGRVLSISGSDSRYPSLASAEAAGLFHPNCTHTIGAYIPGLSRVETIQHNEADYRATQEQRRLERQVRRWKKRETVAIEDADRMKAKVKIRDYQARLREHTEAHDSRRKYTREQIKRAI